MANARPAHVHADLGFAVGEREIVATRAQLSELDLEWFVDGNLGVASYGNTVVMYGGNGARPVRVTGTAENHFEEVKQVTINSGNPNYKYLSGGPVFRDPDSRRLLLVYHAEVYRGTVRNFYSVLGLAIQSDSDGLVFQDLGPVFVPNIPEEEMLYPAEICGGPFILKDGFFMLYARDELLVGGSTTPQDRESKMAEINKTLESQGHIKKSHQGHITTADDSNATPAQNELSVARAEVEAVLTAARQGESSTWWKYYEGAFGQPAIGGQSSALEHGNPRTRFMDVTYNTAVKKCIMVTATTPPGADEATTVLQIAWSDDGLHWSARQPLAEDGGEMFYPSIVGIGEHPRQTEGSFFVYYTSSQKGAWDRWSDAILVRRKIDVL